MKLLPWTLPEIKRLLWRFVGSAPSSLFIVWHWSLWRRRKQERARQCHYRRHTQRARPSEQSQTRVELKRKTCPTVLSDQQWEAAQRVIPVDASCGRPRTTDLRQVLNALCYMQATQCSWRTLPEHFPHWQTVCTYLYRWQRLGVWQSICKAISSTEV